MTYAEYFIVCFYLTTVVSLYVMVIFVRPAQYVINDKMFL